MTDGGCWDDKAAEGKAEVADYRGGARNAFLSQII